WTKPLSRTPQGSTRTTGPTWLTRTGLHRFMGITAANRTGSQVPSAILQTKVNPNERKPSEAVIIRQKVNQHEAGKSERAVSVRSLQAIVPDAERTAGARTIAAQRTREGRNCGPKPQVALAPLPLRLRNTVLLLSRASERLVKK